MFSHFKIANFFYLPTGDSTKSPEDQEREEREEEEEEDDDEQ
jgi:hypothetical protein